MLNKISAIPSNLGLRDLKCTQHLATKHSIDITNKPRNNLIEEIQKKTNNIDDKKTPHEI